MRDRAALAPTAAVPARPALGAAALAGLLVVGAGVIGLVTAAPPAGAVTTARYASPTATATTPCTAATPCSLAGALAGATAGDTIDLEPGATGRYVGNFTVSTLGGLTVQPAPGASGIVLTGHGAGSVLAVDTGVQVVLDDLTVTGGQATGGGGGGIVASKATVTLDGVTVTGNRAGFGAGIVVAGGTLTVVGSTVTGNVAGALGGGGIGIAGGTVRVVRSAITGNSGTGAGGGGIYAGSATLVVDDSTLAGNSTPNVGGGIGASGSTVTVEASTVSGNRAAAGSALYGTSGTYALAADILASPGGPPAGGECATGTGATITDAGYNVSDDATCGLTATRHSVASSTAIDGYLGAPGSHGGPTATVPLGLAPASPVGPDPAFQLVPSTFALPSGPLACTQTDQRGDTRASPCDAGAFEVETRGVPTSVRLTASATNVTPGAAITLTASVTPATDDEPGSTIAFSLATSGATLACTPAGSQAFHGVTATCRVTFAAPGTVAVTARYSGDTVFAASTSSPVAVAVAVAPGTGYDVATTAGAVLGFGTSSGTSAGALALAAPVVGVAADPSGAGSWEGA